MATLHSVVCTLQTTEMPVAVVLNCIDYDRVKRDVEALRALTVADPSVSVDRIDGVPLIRAKGIRSYIVADTIAYGPMIHMIP